MRKSLLYHAFSRGFSTGSSVRDVFLSSGGRFKRAVSLLEDGLTLNEAVKKANFPVVESIFLSIGEKTGDLEGVCENLSRYYSIKEYFFSRVISVFIKSFFILFLGVVLAFLLFNYVDSPVPRNFYRVVIFLVSFLFLILILFMFLNPGFERYVSVFLLKSGYGAGLSFEELKSMLKSLGFSFNKDAGYIYQLLSLKREYLDFLKKSEDAGKLEDGLNEVLSILENEYRKNLKIFETFFYYLAIIGAGIIVFYSIYLFATFSFSRIFGDLF